MCVCRKEREGELGSEHLVFEQAQASGAQTPGSGMELRGEEGEEAEEEKGGQEAQSASAVLHQIGESLC